MGDDCMWMCPPLGWVDILTRNLMNINKLTLYSMFWCDFVIWIIMFLNLWPCVRPLAVQVKNFPMRFRFYWLTFTNCQNNISCANELPTPQTAGRRRCDPVPMFLETIKVWVELKPAISISNVVCTRRDIWTSDIVWIQFTDSGGGQPKPASNTDLKVESLFWN